MQTVRSGSGVMHATATNSRSFILCKFPRLHVYASTKYEMLTSTTRCWTRAPNREMCCKPKINHEDLVLNPDGGKSAFVREGSCGQWWPHRAYERFICAENCKIDDLRGRVTSRSCKFMNGGKDFKINNPEDICRCMTKHCR